MGSRQGKVLYEKKIFQSSGLSSWCEWKVRLDIKYLIVYLFVLYLYLLGLGITAWKPNRFSIKFDLFKHSIYFSDFHLKTILFMYDLFFFFHIKWSKMEFVYMQWGSLTRTANKEVIWKIHVNNFIGKSIHKFDDLCFLSKDNEVCLYLENKLHL